MGQQEISVSKLLPSGFERLGLPESGLPSKSGFNCQGLTPLVGASPYGGSNVGCFASLGRVIPRLPRWKEQQDYCDKTLCSSLVPALAPAKFRQMREQMWSAAVFRTQALSAGQENQDLALHTGQGRAFAPSEVLAVLQCLMRWASACTDTSCEWDKAQLCIQQPCPKGKLVLAAQV